MRAGQAGLRYRWLWLALGWAGVGAVVYLSLTSAPPQFEVEVNDKLAHLLSYALLMGWFCQIYQRTAARAALAVLFILLGALLELLQALGGSRHFELADMAANSAGVLLAWTLSNTPLGRLLAGFERRVLRT